MTLEIIQAVGHEIVIPLFVGAIVLDYVFSEWL